MKLKVCGLDEARELLDAKIGLNWFTHLISISGPIRDDTDDGDRLVREFNDFQRHKLRLEFDDITQNHVGYSAPCARDIQDIVRFSETMDEESSVLIHCYAGISRSTAVAFVLMSSYLGGGREVEAYNTMKSASRGIYPNRLIVDIGDQLLNRRGAMVRVLSEDMERKAAEVAAL